VANLGATQFALPAAVELLRSLRDEPEAPQTVHLAATDPANPYGAVLRWPSQSPADAANGASHGPGEGRAGSPGAELRLSRSAGTDVILVNGALAAYLTKGDRSLLVFLPEDEPARSLVGTEVAHKLFALATGGSDRPGMLIADINGTPAVHHAMAEYLVRAGFNRRPSGFQAAPKRA
jgi:ATP-dependent Lhr-like helicase